MCQRWFKTDPMGRLPSPEEKTGVATAVSGEKISAETRSATLRFTPLLTKGITRDPFPNVSQVTGRYIFPHRCRHTRSHSMRNLLPGNSMSMGGGY